MCYMLKNAVYYKKTGDNTVSASVWGASAEIPETIEFAGKPYRSTTIEIITTQEMKYSTSGRKINIIVPFSVVSIAEIDTKNGTMILMIKRSTPPVLGKAINLTKDDQLVVPQGSMQAYKNHPVWGKFKNITEDPSLNETGTTTQQTPAANNGNTEKEIAELKQQLAKKDEEIANLKKQLAKKDEEIAELKRQSESKKASAEPKPQSVPVQPKPAQPSAPVAATAAAPKANGVFKLADYKSKGKLCHTVVKTYVEQHPNVTLGQLKQAFNVHKCEVVESLAVAMTVKDSAGKAGGNYYTKEEDIIIVEKDKVVVWNYWSERYFNPFMERLNALGYTIK